jgi:6-phosphogluconolactonase
MDGNVRTMVFTGCLNRETPGFPSARGSGIRGFDFDEETGRLTAVSDTLGIDNPTFVAIHPSRPLLYAVSEVFGWNEGTVSAYRIDPASGALRYINKQPALGSLTTHANLDRSGRHLVVANYSHGREGEVPGHAVAVLPVRPDGGLGPPVSSVAHQGSGPVAGRQDAPHPHGTWTTPDNRFMLVADLGSDRIMAYEFDAATGRLSAAAQPALQFAAGAGPRHIAFHPGGCFLYVTCELSSSLGVVAYHAEDGSFELLETFPALPDDVSKENLGADVHVSPDGRFLYASNRGHDSIVVHRIDAATGRLTLAGHVATKGKTPRNFALSPSGRFLLVANQNDDSIVSFRIDRESGLLEQAAPALEVGTPMCVKFASLGVG